jgi:hypothetical protein
MSLGICMYQGGPAGDLQFFKDLLSDFDPELNEDREDETYKTALVVVCALHCGPDTGRLSELTRLPREFVESIRQRMVRGGIWTEVEFFCNWFQDYDMFSPVAFWLNVLVAKGELCCRWDEVVGDFRYFADKYAADRWRPTQK